MKPIQFKRTITGLIAFIVLLLPSFGQEGTSDELVGTWTKSFNGRTITISISADHSFQVEFAGDAAVDVFGSCEISGNRVTFNDKGGDYSADVPGVYSFQVSENAVTFTEVNDPLMGRRTLMEGQWEEAGK